MKRVQPETTRCFRFAPAGVSLLLAASLLAAAGCGGGGSGSTSTVVPGVGTSTPAATRGQVRFTIKWPEKTTTRLIPQAAESIKFICKDADDEDEQIMEQVVPRGQTVVTLDLPSVRVRIDAEARSVSDGSGQVLAKGGVTLLVKEARATAEKLTLDSVITQVKLSQNDISVSGDQSVEVSADALDTEGAVVLTAPENWEWMPEDGSAGDIVSYQPTGHKLNVQARKIGTAAFTVKEKETGKTARLTVNSHKDPTDSGPGPVTGQPGYVIQPSTIDLTAGDVLHLQAYWRDNDGNMTPQGAIFHGDAYGVYQIYNKHDGTRPFVALRQGETTLHVQTDGGMLYVPVHVSGYMIAVTLHPGDTGLSGDVEVYVDDTMVMRGNIEGNDLGQLITNMPNTMAIPLPMDLKPGRHYFYAKGTSGTRVSFYAQIIGVADLSGTVSKDEFATSVFYLD